MVNKTSPGVRGGGKKNLKRDQYFLKKGVFKRGGTMLPREEPKQKPSYAPGPTLAEILCPPLHNLQALTPRYAHNTRKPSIFCMQIL